MFVCFLFLFTFFSSSMVIYLILILLLCIVYKLKLNPHAYFNYVNIGTLVLSNVILAVQLVSFCIMNAQLFDANIRAIIATLIIYFLSTNIHSWMILWPVSIQYIFIFISPFVAGRSLFQVGKHLLHHLICMTFVDLILRIASDFVRSG
jgi:hypothetical protein